VAPSQHFAERLRIVGTENDDVVGILKNGDILTRRAKSSSAIIKKKEMTATTNAESLEQMIRIKPVDIHEIQKIMSQQATDSKVRFQLNGSEHQSKHQNATLRVRLCVSHLKRPRSASKNLVASAKAPNPYYEITITTNSSVASYRSYPIQHVKEATWDEAVIDLGLPRSQVEGSHISIDIKVFHCHKKGGGGTLIGVVRPPKDGESTLGKAHPLTLGFQVTGLLRLLSMSIE
jgi:hypothetical protein